MQVVSNARLNAQRISISRLLQATTRFSNRLYEFVARDSYRKVILFIYWTALFGIVNFVITASRDESIFSFSLRVLLISLPVSAYFYVQWFSRTLFNYL